MARQIDPEMQTTLDRLIQIETMAEEILVLRQQNIEYNRKKEHNREAIGAMRRGEVQSNNKLWMSFGDLIVKMPRKNVVSLIEKEQATLVTQIDKVREELKAKTRELLRLQPALTDMDPYVVKLLLQQRNIETTKMTRQEGDSSDEEELEIN